MDWFHLQRPAAYLLGLFRHYLLIPFHCNGIQGPWPAEQRILSPHVEHPRYSSLTSCMQFPPRRQGTRRTAQWIIPKGCDSGQPRRGTRQIAFSLANNYF